MFLLPELFEVLRDMTGLDAVDWQYACQYAEIWKLSVADALLDLKYVTETTMARALAVSAGLTYIPATDLEGDFSDLDFDTYEDLLGIGALPLQGFRLAVCNPYDDLHGSLGNRICEREIVVTERTALFDALRQKGLNDWGR